MATTIAAITGHLLHATTVEVVMAEMTEAVMAEMTEAVMTGGAMSDVRLWCCIVPFHEPFVRWLR